MTPRTMSGLPGLLLLLTACSTDSARRAELEATAARHANDLARLEREQAEFAMRNPMPHQLDLGEDGTILIHDCELQGTPGRESLLVRYTWVNTTGHAVDEARVTLTLRGPSGADERSSAAKLNLPLRFRFSPDSSYTAFLEVPTDGLHLQPGWQWEMTADTSLRTSSR
jgi:hypothetical protein